MSRLGTFEPSLVLKSPQIIVVSCGCRLSRTVSSFYVASDSMILRFFSDVAGGMYTLTILIL